MNKNIEDMHNLINECAEKLDVPTFVSNADQIIQNQGVKIGFLGPFSSGKTSLINSLMHMTLPTDEAATTMSICMIEAAEGVDEDMYFQDTGTSLEPIDISKFFSIVGGDENGIAVIKTKPSQVLPKGTIIVDTPGIDSVGSEVEVTFAYLGFFDAAVYCINSTNGTILENSINFLRREEVQSIANHMVFALTYEDLQTNPDAVKKEIFRQLKNIPAFAKIHDLENRIFFVNAKDGKNNETLVYSYVEKYILRDVEKIRDSRIEKELVKVLGSLKTVLQDKLSCMHMDDSEIQKRQKEIEDEISMLKKKFSETDDVLYDFKKMLEQDIRNQMNGWKPAVASCEGVALKQKVDEMLCSLSGIVESRVREILPSFTVSPEMLSYASPAIAASLNSVDRYKDLSVMIGTSILTAWILPGAGVAANAGEAVAGAGGKAAASQMAKAAVNGAKEASKATKFFGILGNVIKDINPLEHVGSFVASKVKESSFAGLASIYASSISNNVVNSLKDEYERKVLAPIKFELEAKQRNLDEEDSNRAKGYALFKKDKTALSALLDKLNLVV